MLLLRSWYALSVWFCVLVHELGHGAMYKIVARSFSVEKRRIVIGIGLSSQEAGSRIDSHRWIWGKRRGIGFCSFEGWGHLSPRRQWWVLVAGPVVEGLVMLLSTIVLFQLSVVTIPNWLFGTSFTVWEAIMVSLVVGLVVFPWAIAQFVHLVDQLSSSNPNSDIVRMRSLATHIRQERQNKAQSRELSAPHPSVL